MIAALDKKKGNRRNFTDVERRNGQRMKAFLHFSQALYFAGKFRTCEHAVQASDKGKGKAHCLSSDRWRACHSRDDKQAVREHLICQTCSDIKNAVAFRTDKSGGVIHFRVSSKTQWTTVCFSSP